MNLIWLDDFLALAATGNFSRAAEDRHSSQPAFSRRIRALEDWLGVELFDRSSQPARLTEAGDWFMGVARDLTARVARLPGEAQQVAEAGAITLRLAATHALSFTFLPRWLRGLEARMALGPVQLMSDVLARCEALMLQSKVQFVLSHAHDDAQGALDVPPYRSTRIGADVLLPVTAVDGDGAPRHRLDARGRAAVPVLQYTDESGLGRIMRAVIGRRLDALPVQAVMTAHLASVLRTMALDGRGVAWLPRTLVEDDLAAGRLAPAAGAAASDWDIGLSIRLYRDGAALGPAADAFWRAAAGE